MNTQKPVIVVTGGNRGIGFEICRQLAGRGAQVVLTARKPEAGQEAVKKLATQKLSVQFHSLDITKAESIAALRDFLERSFGRLDVLINNAGIITKGEASSLEVKLAAVRETLETNALAPLHLSQTFAPLLKRSKAGRIVNISSGMGQLSDMGGKDAERDVSQGAAGAVWLALDAPQDLTGKFVRDHKVIPW